jgi:eukaryotic-like serine/threonine-protein kinase
MQPGRPPLTDLASQSWYGDEQTLPHQVTAELLAGTSLVRGRFTISRTVGRGAMGRVYAATDHERGRTVALKTLKLRSPEAAHALKQEFRSLRDLVHPNLVRLHELFVEDEHVFFTMDLVDGVPFAERDPTQLVPLLTQLVSGVQSLHAAGKLHRDLKPANVLVEGSGRVVILDFGLVHDQHRSPESSRPDYSGLVGTPRYMAPEVLGWAHASPMSDWYAVGVMLYEALTDSLPDEGGLARLMQTEPPPPPSSRRSGLDERWDAICRELLHPNVEERADGNRLLAVLGVATTSGPVSVPAPRSTELVGRSSHLQTLAHVFSEFQRSQEPVAVLVSGRSGLGKTALVEEFLRQRGELCRVYRGQCHEQEAVSHKAFDEIVDGLVADLMGPLAGRVFDWISVGEARQLMRLFPAIARVPELSGLGDEDSNADPRTLRKRAYDALRSVLARVGRNAPLVLCVDDLQWGDLDSARLLYELFATPERPTCFVLLSYRDDEVAESECLQRLLAGSRCIADIIGVHPVKVTELGEVEAQDLARSLLGLSGDDPPTAARLSSLCREARGSPLLLRELALHYQAESAPPESAPRISLGRTIGLADVVRARLLRLSALAQRLFALVTVAGVPIREGLLRRASGEPDIDRAIIELETARLIRPCTSRGADTVEVVHDGLRSAALVDLSPELVRTLHEDLARAHSAEAQPDVEALCRHYAGAKLKAESAYWAQKAAGRAKATFAFAHAAFLYRRALELIDGDDVVAPHLTLQLANALADAGHGAQAAPLFVSLAERALPEDALEYRRRAAEQWLFTGRIEQGLGVLRDVYESLGMSLPGGGVTTLAAVLGDRLKLRARGTEFVERDNADISPAELLRLDACRAGWMLSYVSPLQGAALQSRYLRLALDVGEPRRIGMGLGIEAVQHSIEGDNAGRYLFQERARKLAERIGTPHAMGFQGVVDSNCAYLAGEWGECARTAETAEHWLTQKCRGSTWELNTLHFFWALSLYYQGRFRELRRRSDAWLADAEERGDLCALAGLRLNGARSWCLADDDPARAHAEIARGLEEWSLPDLGVHRFLAELARIQVQLYEGAAHCALETVRKLGRELRTSTLRRVQLCRVLYEYHSAFVALALAMEDTSKRSRRLARAGKHQKRLEGEGTEWGNALAGYVRAQRLLLTGENEPGTTALRSAVDALEACDMVSVAAAARFRLGQRVGDEEGANMVQAARTFMRSQGVRAPDRLLTALAPGG